MEILLLKLGNSELSKELRHFFPLQHAKDLAFVGNSDRSFSICDLCTTMIRRQDKRNVKEGTGLFKVTYCNGELIDSFFKPQSAFTDEV